MWRPSNGHIILEVIDPRPFSEDEDRAVAFGIDSFTGTSGERLFFGLAATNSTTGNATIGVFSPDREAFLEYDLTRLVSELGPPRQAGGRAARRAGARRQSDGCGMPEQQVLVQMKQFFDVKPITGDVDKLPDGTRVLMVVHPQNLSQRTLYTIDQWVLAGNAAMIFVDPYAENQFGPPGGEPPPKIRARRSSRCSRPGASSSTPRMRWAIRPMRCRPSAMSAGRPVVAQNLPWMALRGDALSHDEAILAQLSAIVMTTAGAFETSKDGVTLRPLIKASGSAVLVDAALAGDRTADPRRLMVGFTRSAQAAGPGRAAVRNARQRLSRTAPPKDAAAGRQADEAKPMRPSRSRGGGRDAQAFGQAHQRHPGGRCRHADGPQLDPAAIAVRPAGRAGLRQQRRLRHQRDRGDGGRRRACRPARARRVVASVRDDPAHGGGGRQPLPRQGAGAHPAAQGHRAETLRTCRRRRKAPTTCSPPIR